MNPTNLWLRLRRTTARSVVQISAAIVPLLAFAGSVAAQTITLYSSYNIEIGATRQLTAYVPLSPNTVTYTVNGIPGGNAMVGTISPTGLFSAPATVPMNNAVIVRATSTAYPAKWGEATMTIRQIGVHLWSASPSSVVPGPISLRLNGGAFTDNTVVTFGGVEMVRVVNSRTSITATGTALASQVGTRVPLVVRQTGIGGTTSETVMISVNAGTTPPPPPPPPPGVAVTINPTSSTLAPGATQAFSASVTGNSNTAVSWSVNGVAGGNASIGTIGSGGLYTAPATVPSPATVTVRATSVASGTAYANASVTIAGPVNPGPGQGTADLAAGSFLEQAAFGPNPASLARVKQIGPSAWLDEQFAMPETAISVPGTDNRIVQSQMLNRMAAAPDQLRQRVAFALHGLIVMSMNKNNYVDQIAPYL